MKLTLRHSHPCHILSETSCINVTHTKPLQTCSRIGHREHFQRFLNSVLRQNAGIAPSRRILLLQQNKRPPTTRNKTKVCSKKLCNPTTQLRGWFRFSRKTTNTLQPQHHNCSQHKLKVHNTKGISRGQEIIKKIVVVTSGKNGGTVLSTYRNTFGHTREGRMGVRKFIIECSE